MCSFTASKSDVNVLPEVHALVHLGRPESAGARGAGGAPARGHATQAAEIAVYIYIYIDIYIYI